MVSNIFDAGMLSVSGNNIKKGWSLNTTETNKRTLAPKPPLPLAPLIPNSKIVLAYFSDIKSCVT